MGNLFELLSRYRAEIALGVALFIISTMSFALGWYYRDRTAEPVIVLEQCSEISASAMDGTETSYDR